MQLDTIQVIGGQEEAIHIGPYSNIKLMAVDADGIELDGSGRVTVQQSVFGCGFSDAGTAAVLLVNIPLDAKIKFERNLATCPAGAGMIVRDSGEGARQLGKGGILIELAGRGNAIIGGDIGLLVMNSNGILLRGPQAGYHCRNFCPDIECHFQEVCIGLVLDATSSLNRFIKVAVNGERAAVSDAGRHNCGERSFYGGSGPLARCD